MPETHMLGYLQITSLTILALHIKLEDGLMELAVQLRPSAITAHQDKDAGHKIMQRSTVFLNMAACQESKP